MPDREMVYAAINTERDYQDALGSDRTDGGAHTVGDYVTMLQYYQHVLVANWTLYPGDTMALDTVRKIAGIAVRCMEEHGALPRE